MSLRFSIVINTYNRAAFLARTLESLAFLRHDSFEVVVVNGPSDDNTAAVLEPYRDRIKIGSCPVQNLAVSRNIGIRFASGDIVAFLDDDAIPEPDWLNALEAGYAGADIGAVGGFTRDNTGVDFQCRYIVCNRAGDATLYDTIEEAEEDLALHPDHYQGMLGANSSFRRAALLEIGGFDEEYAYFLDETDACMRLVDKGWKVRTLPDAEVHHKFAASHLRDHNKVPRSMYFTTRSKIYFAFRNARPDADQHEIFGIVAKTRDVLRRDLEYLRKTRLIDLDAHKRLRLDVERGFRDGIRDAHAYPRGRHSSMSAVPPAFKPYPVKLPAGHRQRLILVTQEYPPRPCGGVGVFLHRLAEALATLGHEISVVTRGEGVHTVDFENGVWVHRISGRHLGRRDYPALPDLPDQVVDRAFSVYDEALRIQARRGATATLSSIWDLEAIVCVASTAFTDLVYLVTTYQLSVPSKPEWQRNQHYMDNHVLKMIAGEQWMMDHADQVVASTSGILADVQVGGERAFTRPVPVLPFGLPPADSFATPEGATGKGPTILYVGRFELRKGIDVLLDAIPGLARRFPQVQFRLAGDDSIIVDGKNLKAAFLERHAADVDLLSRVHFLGFLADDQLAAEYAGCDIFVAPSRYESFGLIYLEAMRWAKVCVGCDVGGIPDVIGDTGLLVPPGNAAALEDAIARLIADPEWRHMLGSAGLRRFQERFSIDVFSARIIALLEKLRAEQSSQPAPDQAALPA